jgi:predicted DCC family thiol-disulfide oxidoreductase YuxK
VALTVLYDARCRVCTRIAARLARLDRLDRLRFVPLQMAEHDRPEVRDLAASRDLASSLHVVDEAGRWSQGGEAMIRIWELIPSLWPLVRLARLPGVRRLVEPAYRFVADHRPWFGWLAGSRRCCAGDGRPDGRGPSGRARSVCRGLAGSARSRR